MAVVLDRVASHFESWQTVVVDRHDHVAGAHLRMRQDRSDVVDRRTREVGSLEPRQPLRNGCAGQRTFELDLELAVVLGAQLVRREPSVVGDRLAPEYVAEPTKQ